MQLQHDSLPEDGASVLMLEKIASVGYPVRCGEAVSHEGVIQFIQPDPKWIAATVKRFRLVAPNGNKLYQDSME